MLISLQAPTQSGVGFVKFDDEFKIIESRNERQKLLYTLNVSKHRLQWHNSAGRTLKLAGKRILITGADGFIGSHLSDYLVKLGCDVRAFIWYNAMNSHGCLEFANPETRDSIEIFQGDIRDASRVAQAVKGCDVVMHLAALIAIPYSYQSPASYIDTNIHGTLNVLQAVRDLGVQKVIHTSTSEVYGTARFVPITEEHPLQGQSPYSASKIGADQLAISFHRSFETPVAIIRPFNTYGPRQSARAVIPTVITQLSSGMRTIKLGSTTPTRDFNFVNDTVRGFVSIAETEQTVGEVINIGSNFEISIADTARLIADVMNIDATIALDEERVRPPDSEVERLWCDNTKAAALTGWQPAYGGRDGLARGLEETVTWFTDTRNLKDYAAKAASYTI